MRSPRLSDAIWFVLLAFALIAIRMIFAPDPDVPCPKDTSCDQAGIPASVFFDAAKGFVP